MFPGFHFLEESLKHYLTEAQSNSDIPHAAILYKYNNLKIYMDPKTNSTPHIIIRIGISEAIYDIRTWTKISGGLGTDEGIIKRWFDRNMDNFDFIGNWRNANRPKTVSMRESEYED